MFGSPSEGFISNPRIGRPSILAPLSTALGGAFRISCEINAPTGGWRLSQFVK